MTATPLATLIDHRLSRRNFLVAAAVMPLAAGCTTTSASGTVQQVGPYPQFAEISHGADERLHVADGYTAQVLIRWGDPVTAAAPSFDPRNQSAAAQIGQFGYNNDYLAFIPLPPRAGEADRGVLCINHEYASPGLMFPKDTTLSAAARTDIELAACGLSAVEIVKRGNRWSVERASPFSRRYSALDTIFEVSGPARGVDRMKTPEDATGTRVIGTLANCAGGSTPWGTYLSGEENFDFFFNGPVPISSLDAATGTMFQEVQDLERNNGWWQHHPRFDLTRPGNNEANRFGWIVEIDPLDPGVPPKKRTALGRMKHEGAETVIAPDGRLVVYTGDDEKMQHLYRFVSRDRVDPANRAANRDLLDHGVLSVARFDEGGLTWLPLVFGQGPLTRENRFTSQADVMIDTRRAAWLLGATPLDRPEDVQPNPVNGRVYLMLTNNRDRTVKDDANPRLANAFGHIVELQPPSGDHTADRFGWDILVLCGDPAKDTGARYNPRTSANGWFAAPDNCTIDPQGRLWVATDQGSNWRETGTADGVWALGTDAADRGLARMFFRAPIGAEMCGPCFAPDGRTFFLAVQHPAADGVSGSTFDTPATRWPDFDPAMPPRPSVVAITRDDGGVVGG